MTYYVFIQDEEINGKGECKCLNEDITNIEVEEDVYNNLEHYIYDVTSGNIIIDPDYDEKQAQKEKERIGNLTCTKRVFALMLQELGVDYLTQLKPLIESNPQAQLEWDLCVELLRSNPMLDLMASQLSVTSEQLDNLFKYANGEITIEEFRNATTNNN